MSRGGVPPILTRVLIDPPPILTHVLIDPARVVPAVNILVRRPLSAIEGQEVGLVIDPALVSTEVSPVPPVSELISGLQGLSECNKRGTGSVHSKYLHGALRGIQTLRMCRIYHSVQILVVPDQIRASNPAISHNSSNLRADNQECITVGHLGMI